MQTGIDARLQQALLRGGKVRIDSREVRPGDIFFGLRGEHVDGSQFAQAALEAGASVAVVSSEAYAVGAGTLVCGQTLTLLHALARWRRARLSVPVVGITGSSGKTTTKELLVAALSSSLRVAATEGNLNNALGVPLTVANLPQDIDIAVVEMGASRAGDIEELCSIAMPSHGLITSVGSAHLAGFGDIVGVMRAKGELFDYLKRTGGVGFVREDDPHVREAAEGVHLGCMAVGYSLAGYGVEVERSDESGLLRMRIRVNGKEELLRTQLVGDYNAINVVAAVHVAYYFNVSLAVACRAIENYAPSNHRSQLVRTVRNRVIADCYNANPSSMLAALGSFARHGGSERWVILGEMREMGVASEAVHREVAARAEEVAFGHVLYVGEAFRGLAPLARWYADAGALRAYLHKNPISGAEVLVKGSHSVGLEGVLEVL